MADDFKPGDVVCLKSGGPRMTVAQVDSNGKRAWCEWFNDKERKKERTLFDFVVLVIAPPEEKIKLW